MTYMRAGDIDTAIREVQEATHLTKSTEPHLALGWLYSNKGDLDRAIPEFQSVLKVNPNSADAHNGLGWAYVQNHGDMDEAIEDFQAAIRLDPKLANAYTGWGYAHYDQDNY